MRGGSLQVTVEHPHVDEAVVRGRRDVVAVRGGRNGAGLRGQDARRKGMDSTRGEEGARRGRGHQKGKREGAGMRRAGEESSSGIGMNDLSGNGSG